MVKVEWYFIRNHCIFGLSLHITEYFFFFNMWNIQHMLFISWFTLVSLLYVPVNINIFISRRFLRLHQYFLKGVKKISSSIHRRISNNLKWKWYWKISVPMSLLSPLILYGVWHCVWHRMSSPNYLYFGYRLSIPLEKSFFFKKLWHFLLSMFVYSPVV